MSAMDSTWNLQALVKELLSKNLRTHDVFDARLWDDIGSLLANARRGFYLQRGDAIEPNWDRDESDPPCGDVLRLFPGYAFKVVQQEGKKKWDVFTREQPDEPMLTLKTERGAWNWVKARVEEGYYEVVRIGVGYRSKDNPLLPSEVPVSDRVFAQTFLDESFRKILPSLTYTNLLHRLNRIHFP